MLNKIFKTIAFYICILVGSVFFVVIFKGNYVYIIAASVLLGAGLYILFWGEA